MSTDLLQQLDTSRAMSTVTASRIFMW